MSERDKTPVTEICNIVYGRLQSQDSIKPIKPIKPMKPEWLIEKLKNSRRDWFCDHGLLSRITKRLNEIGYEKGESIEQFSQNLNKDTHLTYLLTLISTDPTTEIGNTVYPQLKSEKTLKPEWLIEKLKSSQLDWFYHQELFSEITNLLNNLGCEKDESLEQFNQFLKKDIQLSDLLKKALVPPPGKLGILFMNSSNPKVQLPQVGS